MARLTLLLLLFAAAWAVPAHGATDPTVSRLAPAEDAGIPFACEWGYDWDEVCYRDFGDRLPIGGEADKIWRPALRFPLRMLPAGSIVMSATLFLPFDRVCVGPRKTDRICSPRSYTLAVHPVLSAAWHADRELEFGPVVTEGSFWADTPQTLSFDVTDLVIDWVEYGRPNHGLLLKLADEEEHLGGGGPKLPSCEFPNPALRPALEVTHYQP
jgi:hypothetical protein